MSSNELYEKVIDSPILVYPPISPESDPVTDENRAGFFADLDRGLGGPRKGLLYFHIPFCTSRCAFCTYAAVGKQTGDDMIGQYLVPFFREIDSYAQTQYAKDLEYDSIFIGGGSPSMLTEEQLEMFLRKIHDSFDISKVKEFSMEYELRTMTEEKLRICKTYGVTRISFGWQTFVPKIRKIMALAPTEDELRLKTGWLRDHGYSVNADLMFGMPQQTFDDWKRDVDKAIEFGFNGLDLFKTENVPPAPMYKLSQTKNWRFADSFEMKDMFLYAFDTFEKHGYLQDSFQRVYHPDYPSSRLLYNKHRALANYDQLSIGTGAWGFIANRVYVNEVGTHEYLSRGDSTDRGIQLGCMYEISQEEYIERSFVQGLSHNMVLSKDLVGGEVSPKYREVLDKLKRHDFLIETDEEFRLTRKANGYVFNIAHEFFSKKSKKKSLIYFMHQRKGRKSVKKKEQKKDQVNTIPVVEVESG